MLVTGPRGAVRLWPPRPAPAFGPRVAWGSLVEAFAQAFEQRRLFVLLPFSLIVGLIAYAAWPSEPGMLLYGVAGLVALGVIGGALLLGSLDGLRLGVQLAALALGFCLLPLHAAVYDSTMLTRAAYGTYEARVDEIISAGADGQRVVISELVPLEGARMPDIRRARLFLPNEPALAPGDRIRAAMRLAPVPGPVLPGAHDGQFHAYFSGIGAYGSVTGGTVSVVAAGDEGDMVRRVQALRNFIGARIDAVLEGASAAIGKAMVMGDQSDITDETRDVMAASGLAHIYSISGLHLSIVAGGIFWLVRLALASVPLAVGWPVKKISAVAGILAAFFYLLLAGGMDNVPAFRSTLMLGLIFGAVLAGRRALTMRNVAIAAFVILLIDPASLFRPSFQLSFSAVVALIGVYEMPRGGTPAANGTVDRLVKLVSATAWTSFIAGFATLLFSAYHFQQTAPLGVVGNLLALPFVSFVIMPFGVLSVLAMPFGADAPFLMVMGWGIERMVDVAELVAGWSAGLTGNPLLAGWTLLVGLLALAWFALLAGRWRLLLPALAMPLILVLGFEPRPDVLVADTTQAVAISSGEGMALANGRTGSFAVDVWSRHYQTPIAAQHPGARCDSLGCVVSTDAFSVAIVRNAAAFAEDCFGHDLVIARIRPPVGCGAEGVMIGPEQLAAGGVHWLHWDAAAGRFDVRPAITKLNRPWRVVPR